MLIYNQTAILMCTFSFKLSTCLFQKLDNLTINEIDINRYFVDSWQIFASFSWDILTIYSEVATDLIEWGVLKPNRHDKYLDHPTSGFRNI